MKPEAPAVKFTFFSGHQSWFAGHFSSLSSKGFNFKRTKKNFGGDPPEKKIREMSTWGITISILGWL